MAVDFCHWLSEREGTLYRLPTEAEWAYAAYAGVESKWISGGDDSRLGEYAWYRENAFGVLQPVAKKRPNSFGLFDVYGNAWEWCADDWTYAPNGETNDALEMRIDPLVVRFDNPGKVFRGGACHTESFFLRLAIRSFIDRSNQHRYYGFRVAAMSIPLR